MQINAEYEGDGEKQESNISLLNIRVSELRNKDARFNKIYEENFIYNEKEVGIRHIETKSRLKINDNGNIELFSDNNTGIIVNNEFGTTNLYGEAINENAPLIRMNTQPNGLMWNNHSMNPYLYLHSDKKNPNWWDKDRKTPLPGLASFDDLKLTGSVRWWCPGDPSLCGKKEPHRAHWVKKSVSITPFYWEKEDEEYRKKLDKLNIP